jgi:hypothetical protein
MARRADTGTARRSGFRGAGSVVNYWTPDRLGNLVMRLEASEGMPLVSGRVSTWTDQSPAGNSASAAGASNRPLYETGVLGSGSSVLFDGVDDSLVVPALHWPSGTLASLTVAWVGQALSVVNNLNYWGYDEGVGVLRQIQTLTSVARWVGPGDVTSTGATILDTTPALRTYRWNGATQEGWIDGARNAGPTVNANAAPAAEAPFGIGANPAAMSHTNVRVGGFWMASSYISDGDIVRLYNYCRRIGWLA